MKQTMDTQWKEEPGVQSGKIVTYKDLLTVHTGENDDAMVPLNDVMHCAYTWLDMLPYTGDVIYVREAVADKLVAAEKKLKETNPDYFFRVFYGYRHPDVQQKYFEDMRRDQGQKHPELNDDELDSLVHNYIAVPTVAGHPTGGAIDITITTEEGDIRMGSGVEDFSDPEKMHTFSETINDEARANRKLLHDLLVEQGFAPFYGEWWHFSYGDKEWAYFYGHKESLYSPIALKTIK